MTPSRQMSRNASDPDQHSCVRRCSRSFHHNRYAQLTAGNERGPESKVVVGQTVQMEGSGGESRVFLVSAEGKRMAWSGALPFNVGDRGAR
jgi:hypothetical protein